VGGAGIALSPVPGCSTATVLNVSRTRDSIAGVGGGEELWLAQTTLEVYMTEEETVPALEEFAEHLMGVLNGGALALMLSVGHQRACSTPWLHCHPPRARRSRRQRA
jgi:hypothetical protein